MEVGGEREASVRVRKMAMRWLYNNYRLQQDRGYNMVSVRVDVIVLSPSELDEKDARGKRSLKEDIETSHVA